MFVLIMLLLERQKGRDRGRKGKRGRMRQNK